MADDPQGKEEKIQASLARARARVKTAPKSTATTPIAVKPAGQYIVPQHELWPEVARALPNEIVRSALFNAKNKKSKREHLKNAEIAVIGTGKMTYSGEELRQDDQTLWLQLIHLARSQPLGQVITFTPNSFCQAVGWNVSGKSYERIRECLTRLQATSLSIYSDRLKEGVSLSMVPKFRWFDEASGTKLKNYQVQVAPELVELFADMQYTQTEWQQRLALPVGLATWLHGYLASHKTPFAIKIDTIRKGAGMSTESMSSAQQTIENALEALREVGFLESWKIQDGLVHFVRAPKP